MIALKAFLITLAVFAGIAATIGTIWLIMYFLGVVTLVVVLLFAGTFILVYALFKRRG